MATHKLKQNLNDTKVALDDRVVPIYHSFGAGDEVTLIRKSGTLCRVKADLGQKGWGSFDVHEDHLEAIPAKVSAT